jgi:hypothetical protein
MKVVCDRSYREKKGELGGRGDEESNTKYSLESD